MTYEIMCDLGYDNVLTTGREVEKYKNEDEWVSDDENKDEHA